MAKQHRIIATLLFVTSVGAVAANVDVTISNPPEWLVSWTGWVGAAAAILLVPGLIVDATASLREMVRRK